MLILKEAAARGLFPFTLLMTAIASPCGMPALKCRPLPLLRLSFIGVLTAFLTCQAAHACDFAAVKQQIDAILDQDAAKAAQFRHDVHDGWDSMTVLQRMVSPTMSEMIDLCRYRASEYLAKRGFPPGGH